MPTQVCKMCKEEKELDFFYRNSLYANGRLNKCKACVRKYDQELKLKARIRPENGNKKCSACCKVKEITEYHIKTKNSDGLRSECKECTRKQEHKYRNSNKDQAFFARLKWKYGLSQENFLKILNEQENKCWICKEEEKLVVDHCHKTGIVRGLLCKNCNAGLGMFGDKEKILLSAIDYLKDKDDSAKTNLCSHPCS